MTERIWLAASRPDPEWAAIGRLLHDAGERIAPDWRDAIVAVPPGGTIYAVEREDWGVLDDFGGHARRIERIDHHAPGDPGYGRPPAEFLSASSIGQVVQELARLGELRWEASSTDKLPLAEGDTGDLVEFCGHWLLVDRDPDDGTLWHHYIPDDIVFAAAADHCLAAAYQGECPGVDPDALMAWRIEQRAAFQGRPVADVLADIERARERLRDAPKLALVALLSDDDGTWVGGSGHIGEPLYGDNQSTVHDGHQAPPKCWWTNRAFIADLRGQHVPELPEAAAREGIAFLATVRDADGREKVVLQCATPEQIAAWPAWAAREGLIDLYGGDPARGFAGAYLVPAPRPH